MSEKAKDLKKGTYEHFKGKKYKVLEVGLNSESLEEMVVYQALYGDNLVWIRPIDMFFDEKETVDGKKVPRFTYIG